MSADRGAMPLYKAMLHERFDKRAKRNTAFVSLNFGEALAGMSFALALNPGASLSEVSAELKAVAARLDKYVETGPESP